MTAADLELILPFRPPLDLGGLFEFLRARAVPGVEEVGARHYSRSIRLPGGPAIIELRSGGEHISARVRLAGSRDSPIHRDSAGSSSPGADGSPEATRSPGATRSRDAAGSRDATRSPDAGEAIARVRALLDLDADPDPVRRVLGADPHLGALLRANPGVRVPGSVDGTESLVRAILGQQVSVAAARTAADRLARALGEPLNCADGSITRLFPTAEALAAGVADVLTGPRRRIETVRVACSAIAAGTLAVHAGRDPDELRAELQALPGIGPWTANYVLLRVLRAPTCCSTEISRCAAGQRGSACPSSRSGCGRTPNAGVRGAPTPECCCGGRTGRKARCTTADPAGVPPPPRPGGRERGSRSGNPQR